MLDLFGHEVEEVEKKAKKVRFNLLRSDFSFFSDSIDVDIPDSLLDLPDFESIWARNLVVVDLDDDFPVQQAEARQTFRNWHSDLCRSHRRRTPDRFQCGQRFTVGSIINSVDSVLGSPETR